MKELTKIRLRNPISSLVQFSVELELRDARPSDRYIVKSVDGLGPSQSNLFMKNTINQGSVFQGRNFENREIQVLLKLNPRYDLEETVMSIRQDIYKLMTDSRETVVGTEVSNPYMLVDLYDENGVVSRMARGYVKGMEPNIFTKDPELMIRIGCPSPYLEAPEPISIDVKSIGSYNINYPSDIPVGFEITAYYSTLSNVLTNFYASQSLPYYTTWEVNLGGSTGITGIANGDTVRINTMDGSKGIFVLRSGAINETDITRAMTSANVERKAPRLYPGSNTLNIGLYGPSIAFLKYTPKYWGL